MATAPLGSTERTNELLKEASLQTGIAPITFASNIIPTPSLQPTTPINLTPPAIETPNYPGIIAGSAADLKARADAAQKVADTAQSNLNDPNNPNSLSNLISSLSNEEGNKGIDTAKALESTGATASAKRLAELSTEANNINLESTIANQTLESNAAGKDVTTQFLGRQQQEVTRQAAIKTLTLSQQANIESGNYTAAKDAAQRIIDLKYAPIEAKLATLKQQYDFNKDFLQSVDKKAADALALSIKKQDQDLADKKATEKTNADLSNTWAKTAYDAGQTQLASQITALDPASKTFSQDLLKLQSQIQPDLSKVLDIQNKELQNQKLRLEINAAKESGSSSVSVINDAGKPVTIPVDVAPYYNVASNGVEYIDASTLQGTAKDKTNIIQQAQKAGYKVITNKNTAADLVNIKDANSKLDTVSTIMAGIGQPNWIARALGGAGFTNLQKLAESDPQKAASGALETIGLDVLKAMSGVQGFRGNQTAIQNVTDHLPKVTDTIDTINTKVDYIKQLISDREVGIVGKPKVDTGKTDQVVNGVTYSLGADGLYYPKK